ncbi:MAG: TonB-dependent receptor plug domain-containing protein [Deltaproteobacteria bacterium]|nr:TonB-dependent receptor plug domain-containing protein [Deltaproteobacteria bacterium]
MSNYTIICTILLLLLIGPITGNAREDLLDLSLEELGKVTFTTSSRIKVPFDETIGTAYSIDRKTIRKRNYQSLKDLLEHIPGFVVLHRDIQYVAGVRGLNANDNQKLTLMVNGYEIIGINEPDFLNGPINLDEVEKVEVIVGPSSFFEAANTLVATVNVITRKVDGTSLSVTTGSDVDYRGTVAAGKEWQEDKQMSTLLTMERRIGFSAFDEKIEDAGLQGTKGHSWVAASERQYHFVTRGRYKGWSGQLQAYESKRPHISARGGYVISSSTAAHDRHLSVVEQIYSASLRNEQKWSSALISHAILRAASRTETKDPETGGDGELKSRDYNLELGGIYSGKTHIIQTGVQASHDDYVTFRSDDGDTFLDGSANALGFYFSDTWEASEKLKTVLGLRADRNTVLPGHDWFPGGRAALVYKATDNWTSKLMYNHVVKMPAPMASRMELWGANNAGPTTPAWAQQNDTADMPERLSTLEWQNILYFSGRKGRSSFTLYYQYLQDFISWGGPWTNLSDYKGWGAEGDVRYRPKEGMDNWLNFSWLDSTFDADNPDVERHILVDDDHRMIGSPRLTVNAGTTITTAENVFLSPSARYMTAQSAYDVQRNKFKTINNRYYFDVGLLWNKAFSIENTALRLRIRNVLDNRDHISGSWLKGEYEPRGINGNISLDFEF